MYQSVLIIGSSLIVIDGYFILGQPGVPAPPQVRVSDVGHPAGHR